MTIDSQNSVSAMELMRADASTQTARAGGRTAADETTKTSWFEAMARAWGDQLDQQADRIIDLSNQLGGAGEQSTPGKAIEFQGATGMLTFMSQAANNSVKTAGRALETLARKN